tara:strand:+ start:254 stop:898 length:645 start_codon:yes stop_codon:yes gene_type:complete
MNEETQIVIENQKHYSLKSFFLNNKKISIFIILLSLITLFSYFFYNDYKKSKKIEISDQFNLAIINYSKENPDFSITEMKKIINIKETTYSPLALYFLLDNNLITNKNEINEYFDILINEVHLDNEIKNLIIYKKGLYNSDTANEQDLLKILNPLINSENLWKSHALLILAEYFYSKDEKQKSKEFYEKILTLENSNSQIRFEAQKRLQRDFSV